MGTLLFVLGPAGAGKTTIAAALAQRRKMAVLDMDTLLRPAAEAIMRAAGLDPEDRDSEAYKTRCRDLGYRITMDATLDNLALGLDACVIGPFTQETSDADWLERELAPLGAARGQVQVRVLMVHLSDLDAYRSRIEARASRLDRWKLEHWETFSRSLARREVRWPLAPGDVLHYDNARPLTADRVAELERFLGGASQ
ncbi:AAA family ATPase [Paenibacillus sp. IB182496]|uniref:AAA family ATPase n=1 Tax=Paenibacillus sabuli TaxID=2772509 RepID=A0A927BUZ2_9BACL|nr:AAA family ATPase [Paenibacillus sabuli]MBD2845949.1 AAA family ATPase [Paenibacillus sabuli]